MLYIKEDSRGQGIGGRLIDHMETLCLKEKLFTSTNLSNLRMQRLLEKKNFVISGVIRNLDEGDPEIVYVKKPDNEKID
jgi:ribosomal protein S18 acetylase RimI-like enzyme